jgi:hypothetical protein
MITADAIRLKFSNLSAHFDERARCIWVATEADVLGYGGVALVSNATGISRVTI